MKPRTVIAGSALALGIPALAAAQGMMADMDTDGSGDISMQEMAAQTQSLSAEQFSAMDKNGDGVIDRSEFTAAMDDGMLVTGSGDAMMEDSGGAVMDDSDARDAMDNNADDNDGAMTDDSGAGMMDDSDARDAMDNNADDNGGAMTDDSGAGMTDDSGG